MIRLFLLLVMVLVPVSIQAQTFTSTFESGTPGAVASGPSGLGFAGFRTTYSAERAHSGSQSARGQWLQGDDGRNNNSTPTNTLTVGGTVGTFSPPLPVGNEVWYRAYVYFQSPWSFAANPVTKMLRLHVTDSAGGNRGYVSILLGGGFGGNIAGHPAASDEVCNYQLDTGVGLETDKWVCLEIYLKFSDTNPTIRIWKDGTLIHEDTTHCVALAPTDVVREALLRTYWNTGAPQDQVEFYDDIVVTSDPPSNHDANGNVMIGPTDWAQPSPSICVDDFNSYPTGVVSGTKACPNGEGSWSIDHFWNTASVVSGAGPDGSNAVRINYDVDQLNRYFDYSPVAAYQDFWVKFNFKVDCGAGSCVGGAKFLKIFNGNGSAHQANTTTGMRYQSGLFEQLSYGCTGEVRDTASIINYNGVADTCPRTSLTGSMSGPMDPRDNQWHSWKFHMKYNDNGTNNGIYEVWYDGTLIISARGINNRSDLANKKFDSIQLGGWNQYYAGIPYYIYYDNFGVYTSDPDNSDTTPPTTTAAPSGGIFQQVTQVTLSNGEPESPIYYTTDNTDPRTSPTRQTYTGAITISTSTTLKFYSVDVAGNVESAQSVSYIVIPPNIDTKPLESYPGFIEASEFTGDFP